MKKRRIIAGVLLAFMFAGLITGCSSNNAGNSSQPSAASPSAPESKKPFQVVVTVRDVSDKVPAYLIAGASYWIETLYAGELEVTMLNGNNDVSTQNQLVTDSISSGVDAIIIHPVDPAAASVIWDACQEAGIPLLNFNKEILAGSTRYYGYDEYTLGQIEAETAFEKFGDKITTAVLLRGRLGQDNTNMRSKAVVDACEKYGVEIVADDTANFNRADAMMLIENWLTSGLKFDAIFCNNDEMAIGAALAIEGAGLNLDDFIICGIDSTPDGLEYIRSGHLDVSVFASLSDQTKTPVVDLYNYLVKGVAIPSEKYHVAPRAVTKENVGDIDADWEPLLNWIKQGGLNK